MAKIRERVSTSFYLRHVFAYQLHNIQDGTIIVFYSNPKSSQWFNKLENAGKWLITQEELRLDNERVERPSTKWVFENFFNVDVKVVLDRQPLVGTGPLPDWLQNLAHSQLMVSLDVYNGNLCLWRCLAVHRGAHTDRCTKVVQRLAQSFYKLDAIPPNFRKTSLDELDKVEAHLNEGSPVSSWFGICVYEPERLVGGEVVWHLRINPNPKIKNILTVGVYEGHAFLIKDIAKLAKTYACTHCGQRFTKTCNLQHHHETCSAGKTVMIFPGTKVEVALMAFEKVMYPPKGSVLKQAILWLEWEAKGWGIQIHHAMCGHGGERWLKRGNGKMKASPVDGYNYETRTVFQYRGCPLHTCPKCYPRYREQMILNGGKTPEELYQATMNRTAFLRKMGYGVVKAWSCKVGHLKGELPKKETKTYPYAIIYDFESYGDKKY